MLVSKFVKRRSAIAGANPGRAFLQVPPPGARPVPSTLAPPAFSHHLDSVAHPLLAWECAIEVR